MSQNQYPDHLNPFQTRRRSSLTESFRAFTRSIRSQFGSKKQKHKEEKAEEPWEGKVQLRHKTHTLSVRQNASQQLYPRPRIHERYKSAITTNNNIENNPFEVNDTKRSVYRKKRRAPLPPKTCSNENLQNTSIRSSNWSLRSTETDVSDSMVSDSVEDKNSQFDDGRLSIPDNFVEEFNNEMAKLTDDAEHSIHSEENNLNKEDISTVKETKTESSPMENNVVVEDNKTDDGTYLYARQENHITLDETSSSVEDKEIAVSSENNIIREVNNNSKDSHGSQEIEKNPNETYSNEENNKTELPSENEAFTEDNKIDDEHYHVTEDNNMNPVEINPNIVNKNKIVKDDIENSSPNLEQELCNENVEDIDKNVLPHSGESLGTKYSYQSVTEYLPDDNYDRNDTNNNSLKIDDETVMKHRKQIPTASELLGKIE